MAPRQRSQLKFLLGSSLDCVRNAAWPVSYNRDWQRPGISEEFRVLVDLMVRGLRVV